MEYIKLFEKKLRRHNNRVYKHWKALGFDPLCVTVEWFTTCFVTSCPGELANATFDLLLAGCEDALLKVGLALIDELERHTRNELRSTAGSIESYCVRRLCSTSASACTTCLPILSSDTDMLLTILEISMRCSLKGSVMSIYTTRLCGASTRARMVVRTRPGEGGRRRG